MTVLTVFATVPSPHPVTDWDVACGFLPGDAPVLARRGEDAAALAAIGAEPEWGEVLEHQYRGDGDEDALRARVTEVVQDAVGRRRPSEVLLPLGLFHRDHVMLHHACVEGALVDGRRLAVPRTGVYEDALYRRRVPHEVAPRVARLERSVGRLEVQLLWHDRLLDAKLEALAAYASQLRALSSGALPAVGDAWAPERVWWIRPV